MLKYTQMFSILTAVFFGLALLKFPVRIIFPKTKLYFFFYKAHKPFAIVSWVCLTVHGILALINYSFSLTGLLLYIFLSTLVGLGAYKTYINKKLTYKIFRFHRMIALATVILIILHFLQMKGVIS